MSGLSGLSSQNTFLLSPWFWLPSSALSLTPFEIWRPELNITEYMNASDFL